MVSPFTLCVLSLLLAILYRYVLLPAFISPLAKIPNAHYTSSISALWIRHRRRHGPNHRLLHALHQRLGPIIRLSPTEISVNSLDGLRAIYLGGFNRDPWYRLFENYGVPNLISFMDGREHARQKRGISSVYSKSWLQGSSDLRVVGEKVVTGRFIPMLRAFAEEYEEGEGLELPILQNYGKGAAVDVLDLSQSVAMDMISGYIFGSGTGTNFLQDVGQRRRWFGEYDIFKIQSPQERAGDPTEQSCIDMCKAAEEFLLKPGETDSEIKESRPVVYEQLARHLTTLNGKISKPNTPAIASEILDHLIAGHESTGITLTYALYELSLRPSLQRQLRHELHSLSPPLLTTPHPLPTPRAIDALPLLDAILQETLRLHPAVPAPQPRVTPYTNPPVVIEGYTIPGGTVVSSNAYTLHRNAAVFSEPEKWLPERWMDGDDEKRREMKRWSWAFSSGGRMCVGSNFAVQSECIPST